MRALTVQQPWASLIARGHKSIVTCAGRAFRQYRIAIHAAVKEDEAFRISPAVRELLGDDPLPRGAIVATAVIDRWYPTEDVADTPWICTPQELVLGDFSPGRWAGALDNVRVLHEPIPCPGSSRLWRIPQDVIWLIEAQYR